MTGLDEALRWASAAPEHEVRKWLEDSWVWGMEGLREAEEAGDL